MVLTTVFAGPAGSGKTSLVYAYGRWLEENLEARIAYVNLDPGAENIRYRATFDIRTLFTLKDVMDKYGLGPNGAFIKASELIAENLGLILSKEPFTNLNEWDFILLDTPGQMEVFILRPSGNIILDSLRRLSRIVLVFVMDGSAMANPIDSLTMLFTSILVQLKTGVYVIPVVNKSDLVVNLESVKSVIENPEALLIRDLKHVGLMQDVFKDLVSICIKTKAPLRTILVSATENYNLDALHSVIHESFCACGDLT